MKPMNEMLDAETHRCGAF